MDLDKSILESVVTRLKLFDQMYNKAIDSGKTGFTQRKAIDFDRKRLNKEIQYMESLL